jgi:hypothetical protein
MPSSVKQWIESLRTAARMPMFKPPFLVRFAALYIFALPIALLAQAAVEYALKSAGSAAAVSSNATVAGCRMDSAVLTCLSHVYPQTTILIVVVVCLLIVRWLAGHIGYRFTEHYRR